LANNAKFEKRNQPKLLQERIEELRAEIDAFIEALAQAEYNRIGGGVPIAVIRHSMVARAGSCLCQQFMHLKDQA
jgi:hypothetical protein